MTGHTQEAVEHVELAAEKNPDAASWVKTDPDMAAIRNAIGPSVGPAEN